MPNRFTQQQHQHSMQLILGAEESRTIDGKDGKWRNIFLPNGKQLRLETDEFNPVRGLSRGGNYFENNDLCFPLTIGELTETKVTKTLEEVFNSVSALLEQEYAKTGEEPIPLDRDQLDKLWVKTRGDVQLDLQEGTSQIQRETRVTQAYMTKQPGVPIKDLSLFINQFGGYKFTLILQGLFLSTFDKPKWKMHWFVSEFTFNP